MANPVTQVYSLLLCSLRFEAARIQRDRSGDRAKCPESVPTVRSIEAHKYREEKIRVAYVL